MDLNMLQNFTIRQIASLDFNTIKPVLKVAMLCSDFVDIDMDAYIGDVYGIGSQIIAEFEGLT